jgi:hypothetical protein
MTFDNATGLRKETEERDSVRTARKRSTDQHRPAGTNDAAQFASSSFEAGEVVDRGGEPRSLA